jgi:hypothetical protein
VSRAAEQERKIGLVVASDEIASLVSSVAAAERYLEAIDVENGEYPVAYSPDGRVYRISCHGLGTWDAGSVRITATDQFEPAKLASLLRDLTRSPRVGVEPDLPIEELLGQLARYLIV